ncbi:MAG: hypothetical protein J6S21_05460, partial [Victivallales bacterium]|nr:hypothetical protein [Victivallales bacterium]
MKLPSWQKIFRSWAQQDASREQRRIAVGEPGLCAVAMARVLAAWNKGPVLAVAADSAAAEELVNAWSCLRELAGESRPVIALPEVQPGRRQWIPENEAGRSAALQAAVSRTPALYVATAGTLMAKTIRPTSFRKQVFSLKRGDTIAPEALAEKLVELDYDNEVEVASPGDFARRGGIMDVFSPLYRDPVRIEFWGDEIDSMRFFSAATQCSTHEIDEFKIIPRGAAVSGVPEAEMVPMREYFAPEVPLVLCDPGAIEVHLTDYGDEDALSRWLAMVDASASVIRIDTPPLLSASPGSGKLRSLAPPSPEPELDVALLGAELNAALPEMGSDGVALWHWQQLRGELCRWHESGYTLVACCSGEGELERFAEMLRGDSQTEKLPVILEHRQLAHGLFFPLKKLVLLSDQELFGRESVRRRLAHVDYRTNTGARTDELLELEDGALAVHVNHGICRYHGISCKSVDGEQVEVIELEFADDAKLYVPVEQAVLVSRYMGGSKNEPKLSSLGGNAWSNARKKAEGAAWDLAAELIRLEAMREASDGFQFKAATEWERAFAGSFPYELTADQKEAVEACMADMASPRPMDRLLCG